MAPFQPLIVVILSLQPIETRLTEQWFSSMDVQTVSRHKMLISSLVIVDYDRWKMSAHMSAIDERCQIAEANL